MEGADGYAADRTVVFACGDHRLEAQDLLITETFGPVARRFTPYGGMALYLMPDAQAKAHDYVMYQLDIARHFGVDRVVEVFHGGEARCAAFGHLASRRGLADAGQADHDTLLGLQREAAVRAAALLGDRGLRYHAVFYQVDSLDDGRDRGRLLHLDSLEPVVPVPADHRAGPRSDDAL